MSAEILKDVVRLTNIDEKPPLQAFFEEDILVPDVKPDAARIVSCKAVPRLTEKENYGGVLKLEGDLYLDVMYIPISGEDIPLEVINVRIPFRHEGELEDVMGEIEVLPKTEHLEVSVINERKLRMKTVISFGIRAYEDQEKIIFKGYRNKNPEILERSVDFTDVSEHKKDYIEVKDEVHIGEGMPEIGSVLRTDFRVEETYRQISGEKAIISGSIYYDIMYLSEAVEPEPAVVRGKTEFTQFIKPEDAENISGSDVFMRVDDVRVTPRKDEQDDMTIFDVVAGVSIRLDTYKNRSLDVVEEAYDLQSIVDMEKDKLNIMRFVGSGKGDISLREKTDFPAGNLEETIFVSGEVIAAGGQIENGSFLVEGILVSEILYISSDESGIRSFSAEIPFRGMVEVSELQPGMAVNADFVVRSVNVEKINNRQAEISADIAVTVKGWENNSVEYVKSADFYEGAANADDNIARLIMYIARGNDRLWDIGKRFRTSIDEVKRINGMEESLTADFVPGSGEKLLIWS